eukprot:1610755-Prymnesium_polylepis.1
MNEAGWPVEKTYKARGAFDPLQNVSYHPTLVQLTERHCVATIEDDDGKWIYDSNEARALPLTIESLQRCMGEGRTYEGAAVRAYRFAPGKRARKAQKRAREAEPAPPGAPAKR